MKVVHSVAEMRDFWGQEIGFVPTMGALHEGHLSLCRTARAQNQLVTVSIFVNPTQFNDPKDLTNYPRTLESDLKGLERVGVDVVFLPQAEEIYSDGYRFKLSENQLSQILCGPTRPGHFDGVLTVVLKLLQIVRPKRAYFGEKDYQQYLLIRDMAAAFFLNMEITPGPTVREPDGLAMSSRNMLLTPENREVAPRLYRILKSATDAESARKELTAQGFRVDYVEEHFGRRFAAAFLGNVRLIDNVEI